MLARIRRTFALLIMLLGIPIFGLVVAYLLAFHLGGIGFAVLLAGASLLAGAAGLGLLLLVWLAALLCGERRQRLVVVFQILVRFVAVLLAVLVILQGGIALVGLALLQDGLMHVITLGLLVPMGLGVVYGAYEVVEAAFESVRQQDRIIAGIVLTEAMQPRLWQRIRAVAVQLGARVPDHVVLGLEPNFFATAANVRPSGAKMRLSGETLYLSAPLMGLLSDNEFTAVLGHEFSHFLKQDTAYSLRFVPVYQGLAQMMAATEQGGRSHGLAFLPAQAVLGFTLSRFGRAERSISRKREIEADRAGTEVAGASAVIGALVKIGATDPAWGRVVAASIQAINQGQEVGNLSRAVIDATRKLFDEVPHAILLAAVQDRRQPHPTDSHPNLSVRAAALGVPLDPTLFAFDIEATRAIELLDDREATEQRLTRSFTDHLIARGVARPASGLPRRTAFQMKRDTLAKRAAARKKTLSAASPTEGGQAVADTGPSQVGP